MNVKGAWLVLTGKRQVANVYPKHKYSYEVLEMSLEAANERAHRWEVRCRDLQHLDKVYREILERLPAKPKAKTKDEPVDVPEVEKFEDYQ